MQTAPAADATGTSSLLAEVPTEKRNRSTSPAPSAAGVASSTAIEPSPNGTVEPAERAEANARTFS